MSARVKRLRRNLYPIILNGKNLVTDNSDQNKYRFIFPQGSSEFENSRIAVSNISMYYSWFNITILSDNNSYQLTHPTSGVSTTLTVTMTDGFYSVENINSYLQQELITAGLYLVNADGDYVYYAEFLENASYYSIQFNSYELPTALPAGWSNPAGMTFPAVSKRPQLIVLDNSFTDIIGFSNGTYPVSELGGDYSILSDYTPQITPIQSITLTCNLLNNKYSNPNTILYSFGLTSSYGSLIVEKPTELSFINIQDGMYNEFTVEFKDQEFNNVKMNDTNIIIQLLIENDEEY